MNEGKINILDLILILAKRKWTIIVFVLIFTILAVIYSQTATELWTSTVTILPVSEKNSLQLSSVLDGLSMNNLSSSSSILAIRYTAYLKSKTVSLNVIDKFDLITYFNIKEKDEYKAQEQAYNRLQNNILKIYILNETSFVNILITTKDKMLSNEIANYYLEILIDYTKNKTNNTGRQKKDLFEIRVAQINEELEILQKEIVSYQKEHNIIEIKDQARASIEGYNQILQDYINIDTELNYAEKHLKNSFKHKNLIDQKENILTTLKKLEQNNNEIPFFLALNNVPEKYYTIQEKVFRIEVLMKILEIIQPQLEIARIEEIDDMDKIEIIDFPDIPGYRSSPKKTFICILTLIFSFLFISSLIILLEVSNENDREKIRNLWKTLIK
jgi:uncharacterized protein involved in exopolysaccharide biosynthesis